MNRDSVETVVSIHPLENDVSRYLKTVSLRQPCTRTHDAHDLLGGKGINEWHHDDNYTHKNQQKSALKCYFIIGFLFIHNL